MQANTVSSTVVRYQTTSRLLHVVTWTYGFVWDIYV
jgi:hypothetical protein